MVGIPVTWMVDRYQGKPLKMVIVIVLILDGSSGYVARVDWNRWFDLFIYIYIYRHLFTSTADVKIKKIFWKRPDFLFTKYEIKLIKVNLISFTYIIIYRYYTNPSGEVPCRIHMIG